MNPVVVIPTFIYPRRGAVRDVLATEAVSGRRRAKIM